MKYAINTSQRVPIASTTRMESGCDHLITRSEVFDAVITDPPYLNCPDLYAEEKDDLSNMKQEEWEEKMRDFLTMHD